MSNVTSGNVGAVADAAKYRGKVLAISIAGYAFDGMDIMVFALAAPLLLDAWASLTLVQLGVVATCMLLGMSFGGYIFGPIADKFGRKQRWSGVLLSLESPPVFPVFVQITFS